MTSNRCYQLSNCKTKAIHGSLLAQWGSACSPLRKECLLISDKYIRNITDGIFNFSFSKCFGLWNFPELFKENYCLKKMLILDGHQIFLESMMACLKRNHCFPNYLISMAIIHFWNQWCCILKKINSFKMTWCRIGIKHFWNQWWHVLKEIIVFRITQYLMAILHFWNQWCCVLKKIIVFKSLVANRI